MEITKTLNGNDLTVSLNGYLDTGTSPELRQALDESINSIDTLTIDCANLEYMSSAGLRVLLRAHMTMSTKGGMKLLHVNQEVMDTLKITGMADVLTVEKG